ncbi:hypothetical protein BsWGS_07548 [Bradybaena similaris]
MWTPSFLLLVLLQMVHAQTTERYCGNTPADVVFLLDSSNSMWGPDFIQQLEFVVNVTQMFEIGENATQVGLVTFNDDVQLQFYLNEYRNKERLQRAIRLVRQTYGYSTATDQALKFLRTRFFQKGHGSRKGVPQIAIVITDGQSDHTLKTLIEATKVKRNNIIIFTIGVGNLVNIMELERMASSPAHEHAFAVDSFSFLNSIKEKLAVRTCSVTTPVPTTTTATTSTTPTTTPTIPTTASTALETTVSTTLELSSATSFISTTTTTASTTPTTTTTTTTTTTLPSTTTIVSTEPTTTPVITTTAIPLPTTTTWVNVVQQICEKKSVDIVFALDSSDTVSPSEFWYQVKFVRDFTLGLNIGPNKTRIGVVVYGESVAHVFDVNDHASLFSAISDLYKIKQTKGGARIDRVIHYVRTKSFRRTVSRRESAQLLVLITGSASSNLHRVKKEARSARNSGVEILAVGVGDKVNLEELSIIAGVENYKQENPMDEFAPFLEASAARRRQIFQTPSFSDLEKIVMEATIEACTAEAPPVPVSDQACGTRQEADMMFVMDSASAGKKNTKKTLNFIQDVAKAVDIGKSTVQIGMVQSDECVPQAESFGLNTHTGKNNVVSALDAPDDDSDTLSALLRNVRKDGFKKTKGGRKDAKKIAVVLVDGELEHPLKVLKEARRAQVHGIEVFVIFVGRDPPQQEVVDMCAYPPGKHFFQVPDYDKLKEMEDSIIQLLCDEL